MKNIDMTKGPIFKQMVAFSIPLLIGNVFQQLYTMVDTAILGKFAGTNELAAVGCTGSICFFINTLIIGISGGCSIVVAQTYGAKEEKELKKCVWMSTLFCLLCGLLTMVVGFLFARQILKLLNTPKELLDNAYLYLVFMLTGAIIVAGYNLVSAILRGLGDSTTPLYILMCCSILNVVLDLLFVIQFHMGVSGVALATLISQMCSCIVAVIIMMKKFPSLKFKRTELKFEWPMGKRILKLALPMTFQLVLTSIGFIVMQVGINSLGSKVVAAYTAGNKLDQLFTTFFGALGQVAATFCGQNKGAKEPTRIRKGIKQLTLISVVISLVFAIIIWGFGKYLLLIFLQAKETEVIGIAFVYIRILAVFFVFYAWMNVYSNGLRSLNAPMIPMVGGIIEFVARIACTLIAVYIFRDHIVIWFGAPIAWILTDPALILKYRQLSKKNFE